MSTKNVQVRTSILAKIALSKLESDIKAFWEHLSNPESLKSKESLQSADKIVKDIQRKASKLSEVIIDSEDWENLVEAAELDSEDPLLPTSPKSEGSDSEAQSLFESFSEGPTEPPKTAKEVIFSHAFNWANAAKPDQSHHSLKIKKAERVLMILFFVLQLLFLVKIQSQGSQINTLRTEFHSSRNSLKHFDNKFESTVLKLKDLIGGVDDKVHWLRNNFVVENQKSKNKIWNFERRVFSFNKRVGALEKIVDFLRNNFQTKKVEKRKKVEKIEKKENGKK